LGAANRYAGLTREVVDRSDEITCWDIDLARFIVAGVGSARHKRERKGAQKA